jgi:predicted ATP-dependent endonuclease of OLD family
MKIRSVNFEGLYGSLSRTVDLDDRLNLLVGINGSGKTSILNCIDWMLRPDLPYLAVTQFKSIELHINHEGKDYVLSAKKDKRELTYTRSGGAKVGSIKIALEHLSSPYQSLSEREAIQLYRELSPEPTEFALWNFLETLPNPLTILLDRSISTDLPDGIYFESGLPVNQKIRRKSKSPVEKVSEVTRENYSIYREKVISLNQTLKDRLVISAFKNPFNITKEDRNRKISLSEITRLEKKVKSLFPGSPGTDNSIRTMAEYFSSAKEVARMANDDSRILPAFWGQFRQIGELAAAFDEFDKESNAAAEKIYSYIKTLNGFFSDSGKVMSFNDHDGSLSFQYIDKFGRPIGDFKNISGLSSGERQIIIIMTFLKFMSDDGQVFVIDEPELSLHPKWQNNFLNAALEQAPAGTQIILATHSPEIVSKHRDKCVVLQVEDAQ